jgi:hypothetical protein
MLTAGDVINRLIDFAGSQQGGQLMLSKCQRALADTVRDFPSMYRWNWYKTLGRVDMKGSIVTGTIAFDATTNIVTLTGATWPSWALNAMIRSGTVVSRIIQVIDATHVKLDPSYTFPADLPSGSPYRIFLDCYPLPPNFSASESPLREDWWGGLKYVPPQKWLWGIRGYDITGIPVQFTIQPLQSGGIIQPGGGKFAFFVSPYPNQDRTLDFIYQRTCRPVLFLNGINQGTVATSGDGLTLTATGSNPFVPAMVGSVIRVTNSKNPPENAGIVIHETVIAAVPSSTTLTLTDACPLVSTPNLGYTISDPIDIDAQSMGTAFQWMALKTMAVETQSKVSGQVAGTFEDAYNTAKAADSRYAGPDRMGPKGKGYSPFWDGPAPTETGT